MDTVAQPVAMRTDRSLALKQMLLEIMDACRQRFGGGCHVAVIG
ncbi:MAG: hypothetical protein ACLFTM_05235 [Ectothiorhodospira sp.]